ncbi:MAG: hypothetical protein VW298_01700 [Candidatus Woesearchaeota archaeon]
MKSLKETFELVLEKSELLHKNSVNNDADGLRFWRSIKDSLNESELKINWNVDINKLNSNFVKKIMSLDESNDKNHFLIQHINLVKKNKPNIRKILQIALNIGQLKLYLNEDNFQKTILKYYKLYNLDKFETYIDPNIKLVISDKLYNKIKNNLNKFL